MLERLDLHVSDMSCEGCAETIRNTVMSGPGVSRVDVDLEAKKVVIDYDPDQTTPDELCDRINSAGYSAKMI